MRCISLKGDMQVIRFWLIASFWVCFSSPHLVGAALTGKVIKVADGDTVTLLVEKKSYRVRLQGIDAPEAQQPFGQAAKKALSEKVFGHRVTVRWDEKDRYGRLLGQIYLGEVWVNQLMVQDGYAWHYTHYSKDSRLARSQRLAKEGSRGLWAREQAIAPWDWRRGKRPLLEDSLEASRITQIVYVTPQGEKFHRRDCHHLGTKGKPEALASVRNRGLTSCKRCYPKGDP